MKKILYVFILNILLLSDVMPVPLVGQVSLNGDRGVVWRVKELSVNDNEGIKLIADKFRLFKVTVKNDLDKEICISLQNYFYGFSRDNLIKGNALSSFSDVVSKTTIKKLIFYGPFWANLFFASAVTTLIYKDKNISEEYKKHLKFYFGSYGILSLFITGSWSLFGWFSSIRNLNKTKKQYDLLDGCKPKIKLPRFMFKNTSPKMAGDQLVIPAKSEMTDYLFVPIAYPVNLDGALLSYTVN